MTNKISPDQERLARILFRYAYERSLGAHQQRTRFVHYQEDDRLHYARGTFHTRAQNSSTILTEFIIPTRPFPPFVAKISYTD
jgi:hypothetical protein